MNSDNIGEKMKNKISIDLHLHFDGSLSIDNVKQLASSEKAELPNDDELKKCLP